MKLIVHSLVAAAFLAGSSMANGFISCNSNAISTSHTCTYSFDNGQTFTCPSQSGSCQKIIGDTGRQNNYARCYGNLGGYEDTAFWVTGDGCYNIRSGGNHMYCCGRHGPGSCI